MLAESVKTNQSLEKSGTYKHKKRFTEDGTNMYSIREEFYREFDEWVADGKKDTNIRFVMGNTSDVLKYIGVKNQEILLNSGTVIKKLNEHEEMTTDIFKKIPELLEHPIIVQFSDAIDKDTKKPKYESRISVLGELYANVNDNGNIIKKPVLVSLELLPTNQKKSVILDFSIITSAYAKNALQNYLNNNSILYIEPNKNRTNKWLSLNRLQLPLGETKYGPIRSITYDGKKVKINNSTNKSTMQRVFEKAGLVDEYGKVTLSGRDTNSRKPTEEQQNYFADSNEDKVQNSVREIVGQSGKNYGVGVYLDSSIFDGLNPIERERKVKSFVVDNLAGKSFVAYDNDNNEVEIEIAKADDSFRVGYKSRSVLPALYQKAGKKSLRQESVALTDELISAARYSDSVRSTKSHGWIDRYGKNDWDYWTVYIQEQNGNVWKAILNVANTKDGRKLLYEIDPFEPVEVAENEGSSNTKELDYIQNSDRDFSYDELVSKGDLVGIIINKDQQIKFTPDGSIDKNYILDVVRSKCKVLQTHSSPIYHVNVKDIGRNVQLDRKGITHGFINSETGENKSVSESSLINARVSLELPEILKNSIEVNRASRAGNIDVPYSHIMLGTAALENENGNLDYYAVRFVVEERINQNPILVEANVLGRLKGLNAKKVGSPQGRGIENEVALSSSETYEYNIAHLLANVKSEFDDTFSNDVYKHFGMQRNDNGDLEGLQFCDRDNVSVYDLMGEVDRLVKKTKLSKPRAIG